MIIPISQIRKTRVREVKEFAQSHTAKWLSFEHFFLIKPSGEDGERDGGKADQGRAVITLGLWKERCGAVVWTVGWGRGLG